MPNWLSFFGGIIPSIISNVANGILQDKQNAHNELMQQMQNAHNERLVDKQNAASRAEAEKARNFSTASAQMNRLQAAGLSKAGAVNALTGAGAYTPAPVNVSQGQAAQGAAPQIDLSGIVNVVQGMAQLKEQRRQFDKTMELEYQKFDEEKINNSSMRDLNKAQINRLAKENEVSDATMANLAANTSLTWQELKTECAKTDWTLKQTALVVEQTKLTAEQVLQTRAMTQKLQAEKEEIKERTLNYWYDRGLKTAQAENLWKQTDKLNEEILVLQSDYAAGKHVDVQRLTRLAADMQEIEKQLKDNELLRDNWKLKEDAWNSTALDYFPGQLFATWSWMCEHALPLNGLIKIGTK